MDTDKIKQATEVLSKLLSKPQPGLITWNATVNSCIETIAAEQLNPIVNACRRLLDNIAAHYNVMDVDGFKGKRLQELAMVIGWSRKGKDSTNGERDDYNERREEILQDEDGNNTSS